VCFSDLPKTPKPRMNDKIYNENVIVFKLIKR